ncbi:MAG TPA: hypothetical protein DCW41_04490 [Clostridiales bacterium]|nr:hypothetical protein [Clostridiales bacterium]
MKSFKKVTSLFICASMIASVTACSSILDKSKDQIIDKAEEVANAVCDLNAEDIADLAGLKKADKEELVAAFGEELDEIDEAIADTMSFEIDEDSAEGSTKDEEGSVDVIFTMVDYEAVAEDEENTSDLDTFTAALADSEEVQEIKVTMEFSLEDDEWVLSNYDSKDFDKLFAFKDFEISFAGALIERAEALADAIVNMDVDTIAQICAYDEDTTAGIADILNLDNYDEKVVYEAIANRTTYVINEDSAVLTENGGSIDVDFSEPDYYSIDDDSYATTLDELASEMNVSGMMLTRTETFEFEYDDNGELIISDDYFFSDIYEYLLYYTPSVAAAVPTVSNGSDYIPCVDHTEWWWDDGDGVTYTNATDIELDIIPTIDAQDYSFIWDFYYEVAYNGSTIYTSSDRSDSGMYIEAYFYASDVPAVSAPDGYLYSGEYTITFFALDGTQIASNTCTVVNSTYGAADGSATPTSTPTSTPSGDTAPDDFTAGATEIVSSSVDLLDWWDTENEEWLVGGKYPSGTSEIMLAVRTTETSDPGRYYEFYYAPLGTTDFNDFTFLDYGTVNQTTYSDGPYYDIILDSSVVDGIYICALWEDDADGELMAYGVCTVGEV